MVSVCLPSDTLLPHLPSYVGSLTLGVGYLFTAQVVTTGAPSAGSRNQCAAERSYSTFKVKRGLGEEIPLIQGKEQRLHFAGAAVRRYPSSKVRKTQVRW